MSNHKTLLKINKYYSALYHMVTTMTLLLLISNTAFAISITVTSVADSGYGTLREALAGTADTVFFNPSVMTITLSSQINIDRDVVIRGNGTHSTFIDGNDVTRHFFIRGTGTSIKVEMHHLTLTRGFVNGFGGSIYINPNQELTLKSVTVSENNVDDDQRGGAIYFEGTLRLEDCVLTNNYSPFTAGAISSIVPPAGISSPAKLFIDHSIISGNHSPQGGGGIVAFCDTVSIVNSVITGNEANSGAGLYFGSRPGTDSTKVFIANSTIAGNRCLQDESTPGRGAGIFIWNNTNLHMINTIVGNNTLDNNGTLGPDIYFEGTGTFHDLGGNLISDTTNINTIDPIISIVDIDPQFVIDVGISSVPTTQGDFRLRCSSPAIDKGKDTLGLTMGVDVAGLPRLVNGTIDIGAHERQIETSHMVTNTADDGIGSLRRAVNFSCPGDTVLFDPMIDGQEITLTTGEITLKDDITILGNGPSNTIIDGNDVRRIFFLLSPTNADIASLTLQNGNSNSTEGGAIFVFNNSSAVLEDVHIKNCESSGGAGAISNNGSLTVKSCSFSNNKSRGSFGAGGISISSNGSATIINSTLSANQANEGAGIINEGGTVTMINSTVSGNHSVDSTGGILNMSSGNISLINTIIAGNSSTNGTADFLNATSGTITDDGHNLFGDSTGIRSTLATSTIFGTNTNPLDPIFFKEADFAQGEPGDMRLRCGSPAINAGTPNTTGLGLGLVDLADMPRIVNTVIDIGAYERPAESLSRNVVNVANSGPGSLRDAVVTACPGDMVVFDAGLDGEHIVIEDELVIDRDISIIGRGIENTIIDGEKKSRIFNIEDGTTTIISYLTIRDGRPSGDNGGGIYNEGDVSIDHVVIEDCNSIHGGGVYNTTSGILNFDNSKIHKNISSKGGGMYNVGTASFMQSALLSNLSYGSGGGVYNEGSITFINSNTAANQAGNGSEENGGGIYNDGIFTFINSTISGNVADNGGGVFNKNGRTIQLTNTIIAKNTDKNGSDDVFNDGMIIDNGYNLIGDISGFNQATHLNTLFGTAGAPLDPLFLKDAGFIVVEGNLTPERGNLRLACASPAIDMGTPDTIGLGIGHTDILGLSRIADARVDIGAHERKSASITPMVTNTDDSGLGSLRDEILSVCPTDTLFFDPVTSGETIQLTSEEIVIDRDIIIIGNGTKGTSIDGLDNKRIFFIDNGISASISSLTVINGRGIDEFDNLMDGGCIYVNDGSLELDNVGFSNCHADNGGAIYALDTITLSDCFISGSDADGQGGGIFNSSYASLVNSLIFRNHADLGGGIYNESGAMSFVDTELSSNTADQSGGGILNTRSFDGSPGVITFKNSIISNNSIPGPNQTNNALLGGGVLTVGGESTFINTVIMGNTSEKGGGVFNGFESTATFINSTMSLNYANVGPAGHGGAGLYNDGSANFTNTIVAKNFSTVERDIFNGFSGSLTDNGNNLIGDSTGVGTDFNMSTLLGTEASPLDPNFVDTDFSRDLRLWCTSPAVNAGAQDTTGLQVGLVDLQGSNRIVGDTIDIGAYEYFTGHIGDLLLDGTVLIKPLERATNITAEVGVNQPSTLFQVEETVTLESAFEVGDGKAFEVQVESCPNN